MFGEKCFENELEFYYPQLSSPACHQHHQHGAMTYWRQILLWIPPDLLATNIPDILATLFPIGLNGDNTGGGGGVRRVGKKST